MRTSLAEAGATSGLRVTVEQAIAMSTANGAGWRIGTGGIEVRGLVKRCVKADQATALRFDDTNCLSTHAGAPRHYVDGVSFVLFVSVGIATVIDVSVGETPQDDLAVGVSTVVESFSQILTQRPIGSQLSYDVHPSDASWARKGRPAKSPRLWIGEGLTWTIVAPWPVDGRDALRTSSSCVTAYARFPFVRPWSSRR